MTPLLRLYNALRLNALLREQRDNLLDSVAMLRAELEAEQRINTDLLDRLYEAHEQLLEHTFGCLNERGNVK